MCVGVYVCMCVGVYVCMCVGVHVSVLCAMCVDYRPNYYVLRSTDEDWGFGSCSEVCDSTAHPSRVLSYPICTWSGV